MGFLLHLVTSILSVALVAGWMATRRKLALARGRSADLSPFEMQMRDEAQRDPAFANPMMVVVFQSRVRPIVTRIIMMPCGQWLWRWCVAFPKAAIGLAFYPVTWLIAVPLALFWWMILG